MSTPHLWKSSIEIWFLRVTHRIYGYDLVLEGRQSKTILSAQISFKTLITYLKRISKGILQQGFAKSFDIDKRYIYFDNVYTVSNNVYTINCK